MNKKSLHYKCKNKSNNDLLVKSVNNTYNRLICKLSVSYFYSKRILSSTYNAPYIFFTEKNIVRKRVMPLDSKSQYSNCELKPLSYKSRTYATIPAICLGVETDDSWYENNTI